jgi:hypothetical protein
MSVFSRAAAASTVVVVIAVAPDASAIKRYYIEEVTDFTGNGCVGTDVNTVTAVLHQALINLGWAGQRWTEGDAWPQDWREACSSSFGAGGLDSTWADTKLLAIYAGHGRVGGGNLNFGFAHDGECDNWLGNNSRLGAMSGAGAAYAAYLTSCTLKTTTLVSHANFQWVHQNLGFHNSPSIHGSAATAWFQCTSTNSNTDCWLSAMEPDQNGDDDNSPIVVSYGVNADEAAEKRDYARLKGQYPSSWMVPRGGGPACGAAPPVFWYNWIRINNGTGPC